MFRRFLIFLIAIPVGGALAQSMPELRLPKLGGDRSVATSRASNLTLDDAVSRYKDRREAAVAAFQEAYKAATQQKNRARAMGLLLISLKRDPAYGKALFNMAALCEQEQSWNDALSFYKQTQQADADASLITLAAEQIVRVQEIARLESTPAGQKRRRYDIQLLAAMAKIKDPVVGLEETGKLARIDTARWEGPALTGILQAGLGHYADSLSALQQAENLAPAERRAQLQSAADVARGEASFLESVNRADEAWDKQQYEAAAKSYASAWENNPGDAKVGMQAATGFLLADQVPQAVQILSQLRGSAPADTRPKVTAMLRELGAVSDEAKRAADRAPEGGASQAAQGSAADRIRTLVGQLTTSQMELAARPAPALLEDKTSIVPVVDDELTSARSDLLLLSTESVFTVYQRSAAPGGAAPVSDTPALPAPVPAAPPLPLPAPPSAIDRPAPVQQRLAEPPTPLAPARQPAAAAAAKGSERMVEVASTPAGSLVVFDNNPSVTCVAPCQIGLTPGRHTLVATLAGHRMAQKIVTVEDKKASSIVIEMVAKQGFLTVESKTPGQAIFVNGKKTERVTPANLTLDEGEYEIGVEVDGVLKTQSVTVKDGNLMKVSLE
jgi:tetratricopeptide (TPR) repeat protein